MRQVEVEEENGKQRREKRKSLKYYMIRRLKMNQEKIKRTLCESANKRNVALKTCEDRVEIEQFDLLRRIIKISVQGIKSRTKQMASVQDNQRRMLEEELLKIRDALLEYESKRNKTLKRDKIESLETGKSFFWLRISKICGNSLG